MVREYGRMVNDFILAKKYTLDDCPKPLCEMIYSDEIEGYNYGFWSDLDELVAYCRENNVDVPSFAWCTKKVHMTMNARHFIESACEDLFDEAELYISDEDVKELQEFLDKWCAKQTATETYEVDRDNLILFTTEDIQKRWKA